MAERKSKGEKLPSVKSVRLRARALSRLFLSLSLFSRVEARAFLSSKVALSENLSQIHQNCGREGNRDTLLLLREKDFRERKESQKKKQEREEREREKQKSKNKERGELFFFFFRSLLSLFVCFLSLLFALVFLSIFFLSRK